MKKFLPYIIILAILVAGVVFFLWRYSPSTLEKRETEFAVRHVDQITKIRITDAKGGTVQLTKDKARWLVNGKYDAYDVNMSMLMAAIQKMETQYPVPVAAQPVVLKDMSKERFKCEIYTGADQPAKVYYVGGYTADGTGTYVIMEIDGQMASRPYVVHIPGIDAYLTSRFVTDELYWRTKWIYQDNERTIRSVSVQYHQEKQKSFTIAKAADKDSFIITNSDGVSDAQPNQRVIRQYLGFYDGLSLEAYENKNPIKDTIFAQEPYCTISMKRMDGTQTSVEVFYMPLNDLSRVKFDDNGRRLLYDVEHYYLGMNDRKDIGLIQYYVWGKVLRTYQEFFIKPGQPAPVVTPH